MKVGVLGSGDVAKALAAGFLKHGHQVTVGTNHPEKLKDWVSKNPKAEVASFADTAGFGEVVVLAVKGSAASEVLRAAGAKSLDGKTVIDTTNPIADAPPENGVLRYFTTLDDSLMERLQKEFPNARFVKSFSCVGSALMVDPNVEGGRPTMFLCGNDEGAKTTAVKILDEFGWEAADMGGVEAARAIEPLAILWCIPGFLRNDWMHAYKVVKPKG